MPGKINNLEELRREKELIKLKMKITQQAFFHSLGNNRRYAQRLVINKIALPVGAGALASWLVQLLAQKTKEDAELMEQTLDGQEEHRYWWVPIVRTVMKFIDTYLNQIDPVDQERHSENGHPFSSAKRVEKS